MNYLKKQLACLAVLVSAVHLTDATTSKIVPRSQSFNAARQMVGWNNPVWGINRLPQDDNYSSFNLTFAYTRTYKSDRLAQCLFGNDLVCGPCDDDSAIRISGSAVAERAKTDWLAEYFGLPRNFQSTVTFKPTISNFILDFSFYAGLDAWADGMYFRIHGPFVHTKWNLNATECVTSDEYAADGSYFQGYFSSAVVPAESLTQSFLAYANGAVPKINNDYDLYGEDYCLAGYGFDPACTSLGDITWQSLCCSRMNDACGCDSDGLTRNGFGELRMVLGYNFINDVSGDYHAGLGLYVAAPTGTRVGDQDDCNDKGRYLFEPIVGNGKHWELGAQVTAHHICWRNEEETKSFGMYLEANITHLFAARQIRCFDLCSAGSNSRYMLAERLDSNRNSTPLLNLTTDSLSLEFANEYAPVANITRREITSTIGAQGDVAFTLAYQSGGFQWDLGYNFWGRSCERLCLHGCCPPDLGQWALKGDQRVYGFVNPKISPDSFIAIKMAATDSQANIHQGSNLKNHVSYQGSSPLAPTNLYADNAMRATGGFTNTTNNGIFILPGSDEPIIYTSEKPVLIQEDDFNLSGTRGISNKFFTNFNYAWTDREDSNWTPYVGLGFEVECGGRKNGCCTTECSTDCNTTACPTPTNDVCSAISACCENCALSQWGIWFKMGASYN